MESDAVVGYLEDRLTAASESAVSAADSEQPVLGYNSGLINDYYTKAELGFPTERLGLGIAEEVRQGLKVTGVKNNSILWWQVASAILDMTPGDWTRWKRFHRRNRTDRVFIPPSVQHVGIVLSSAASEAQIVAGAPPVLTVPVST
jgi:hypothetical protein